MSWLLEQPLTIVAVGLSTAAIVGFMWFRTQSRPLLAALLAAILLTGLGVILERSVVTNREAVDHRLRELAREVSRNDLPAVLRHLHSQASPQIRAQAESEFPKYEFESVSIKPNLEITFDKSENPTEATAKFNVMVIGSHRDESIQHWRAPRYVVVQFRKEGDEWRVLSYEHHEPQEGWRP